MSWKVRPARLRSSILLQLLVGGFAATTLVMAAGGAASYWLVKRSWIEQIDRSLESRALGVATACHLTETGITFEGRFLDRGVFQDPHSLEYFEVRDSVGRTLGRSASLGSAAFPRTNSHSDQQAFGWFHPPALHRMRYVVRSFDLPMTDTGRRSVSATVFFGQDFRDAKDRLQTLRSRFFLVWCAAETLLSGLLFLLVRSSLDPLGKIVAKLREVDENRTTGFGDVPVPSEVAPLVRALDDTLGRLSEAFRRERTLLADLAHELRTPLAGLRTTLEVGVDDVEEEARSAMRRSLSIAEGMQSLMESLMVLARLDGGQIKPDPTEIDFTSLVEEIWLRHRPEKEPQSSRSNLDVQPDLTVRVDREWISVVVRNLLENAFNHAGFRGWVECSAKLEETSIVLLVRNDGCRLEASEVARVFDRFWRKDPARSLGTGQAGLGLSLSRELVLRMGGSIEAMVPEPGIFSVVVRLLAA